MRETHEDQDQETEEDGHHQVLPCHPAAATVNHQQEVILQERLSLEAEF